MEEKILPALDTKVLQEKANEFAMKGAIKTLEEFYTGYNSPYRKAIEEDLEKKRLGGSIELPDIIGIINDSLSREIDLLANTAISKSFLPLVKKILVREEKEMKFSEFLKNFIECMHSNDRDDYSVDVNKDEKYGWLNVEISCGDKRYELTFHQDHDSRNEKIKKYCVLSLPYNDKNSRDNMTLTLGDAKLEIPFTRDILKDNFTSFIARLVIAQTVITMDCDGFDDELFPHECHC